MEKGEVEPTPRQAAEIDSAAPEAETVPAAAPPETGATVSQAEYEQVKAERDHLKDRVARLQAEFDNARKRAEREKAEFRDYATGNVVEQFLPVLDNFELALKAKGSADQLRSGVELIVKQMEDALRQLQVIPVATMGEEFDPRYHEALGLWSGTICPTTRSPKRFAAATSCVTVWCGRRWCAWFPTLNSRKNKH